MRHASKVLGLATVLAVCGLSYAQATFFGFQQTFNLDVNRIEFDHPSPIAPTSVHFTQPLDLESQRIEPDRPTRAPTAHPRLHFPQTPNLNFKRIEFDRPELAPMAHTLFCLTYPDDCHARRVWFRRPNIEMTEERWHDLVSVNAEINAAIKPMRHSDGVLGLEWKLHPARGDCKEYAATKRHDLIERGWSSRSLLLAEVVTTWGEHHLVLVVRSLEGDFVLDNLNREIRPWRDVPYHWVRIQSPSDPKFWSTLRMPDPKSKVAAK
jgi:predicted transglutaminase-like cysteine proteinase